MPLPLILGIGAAIAGATGLASGVKGGVKMKQARDTVKSAESRHQENVSRFEEINKKTTTAMDDLGKYELEILNSFNNFANLIEKIQNKPVFKTIDLNGEKIPEYSPEELKRTSVGAGVLLTGLGGAAAGTAGGFAAAGATTAAVMALGTASTGTAIASLSGVAATNATLAALGGGALAAGGGGMALGSLVLGAATAGVGVLIGGIIFNIAGAKISDKADNAWSEMKKAEKEINRICEYLIELKKLAKDYLFSLSEVNRYYKKYLSRIRTTIETLGKTDWNSFSDEEKQNVELCTHLVALLYHMCKVELVKKAKDEKDLNSINTIEVEDIKSSARVFIDENLATQS